MEVVVPGMSLRERDKNKHFISRHLILTQFIKRGIKKIYYLYSYNQELQVIGDRLQKSFARSVLLTVE